MHLDLHSGGRKLVFGAFCVCLAAVFVYRAGRAFVGGRWLRSTDPAALERAIRLEPGSAEAQYRLARVRMYIQQDVPGAVAPLQTAVALNPHASAYWLDLALAQQFNGDFAQERAALEQAVRHDPRGPEVTWQAANFFLVTGDTERALREFRSFLEGEPFNFERAVYLSLRATDNDFVRVLEQVIPPLPRWYMAYLDTLLAAGQAPAADMVWTRTAALGQPVRLESAKRYLSSLEERQDSPRARAVWSDLTRLNPDLRPYAVSDNLVVNPGFEQPVLNAGFDWRYEARPGVAPEIDTDTFHSGSRALLFTFNDQAAVGFSGVHQDIPVDGGQCYVLSAWARSSELAGAAGPRLLLVDNSHPAVTAATEMPTGTHGWEELRMTLRTAPETRFVVLAVVGPQGKTVLRGRAWIDDLRLVRAAPEACP